MLGRTEEMAKGILRVVALGLRSFGVVYQMECVVCVTADGAIANILCCTMIMFVHLSQVSNNIARMD